MPALYATVLCATGLCVKRNLSYSLALYRCCVYHYAVPYLKYQLGRDGKTTYVNVYTGIREKDNRGGSRVRTSWLTYLGRIDAPDFRKKLKAAERKYGPLNLKRRPRRKRK